MYAHTAHMYPSFWAFTLMSEWQLLSHVLITKNFGVSNSRITQYKIPIRSTMIIKFTPNVWNYFRFFFTEYENEYNQSIESQRSQCRICILVCWSKKTMLSPWRLVGHVTNMPLLIHFDFNKPSFGKLKRTKVFGLLNLKIKLYVIQRRTFFSRG